MINKPLNDITIKDLEQLKHNSILEGRTIEYKSQLPTSADSDTMDNAKIKFLAAISSFANAIGGDLIYGSVRFSSNFYIPVLF